MSTHGEDKATNQARTRKVWKLHRVTNDKKQLENTKKAFLCFNNHYSNLKPYSISFIVLITLQYWCILPYLFE